METGEVHGTTWLIEYTCLVGRLAVMVAIACLKIFVGTGTEFSESPAASAFVEKVTTAYLDRVWARPRRHGVLAPFSFALADPNAEKIHTAELQVLASELQTRLFGSDGEGEITLLTFEGNETDVTRFAKASRGDLDGMVGARTISGRMTTITKDDVSPGAPACIISRASQRAALPGNAPLKLVYGGVFNTSKEYFIGNVVVRDADPDTKLDDQRILNVTFQDSDEDFELVGAIAGTAGALPPGFTLVPLSFSSLIRPSMRETYLSVLARFPPARRKELVATIYGAPRAPTYQALSAIRQMTEPGFRLLDLSVTDPRFRIDDLPGDMISSVTLRLPRGSEASRLAALTAFLANGALFKRRRIWQGVAGVANWREFDACKAAAIPFVSGPAIAALRPGPVATVQFPVECLPYESQPGNALPAGFRKSA